MEQSVKDILADDFWIMPATPEYIDEGVPYITSKNIKNGIIDFTKVNYISQDAYENISKNRPILVGDILISMIGTLGETAEVKESDGSFYGQNMFLVRLDESKINKRYFLNFFKSNCVKRALEGKQNQSTQKYLKANHIEDLIIPVPALDEQKLIAKQLDKLAGIIDLRIEELKYLDDLIKARFVELFGLPVSNTKGWKTEQMGEVAPAINYKGEFDDEVWLLNLDMVEAQTGRILDYLVVSEEEVGNSTCTFDTSNVLYSKLRPYLNKVVIPDRCGYATSELVPLQPVKTKINREYLAFMLRSDEFVNMINEKVAGAKMPRVPMGDFRKFDVPVPPMELQEQFADFVKQVDKSKFDTMTFAPIYAIINLYLHAHFYQGRR